MNRSSVTAPSVPVTALEAMLYREAVTAELNRLAESVAYCARQQHGSSYLVFDRTVDEGEAEVKAYFPDGRLVDLWELDPMLWDDAHWAALRLVPAGHAEIVLPDLHRG